MTDVPTQFVGTLILCSDGTVLARDLDAARWWRLAPDATGSYVHGHWSAGPPPADTFRLDSNSVAPLRSGSFISVGDVAREDSDDSFRVIAGPAELSNVGVTVWRDQPVVDRWSGIAATTCSLPAGGIIAAPFVGPPPVASDGFLWQWSEGGGWSVVGELPDEIPVLASLTLMPDGSVLTLGPANEYRYQSHAWETGTAHGLRSDDSVGVVSGPVCLLADGRVLAIDHLGGMALRTPDGRWSPGGQLPDRDGLPPYVYAGSACLLPAGRVLIGVEYSREMDGLIYTHFHYYEWSPVDGSITDVGVLRRTRRHPRSPWVRMSAGCSFFPTAPFS
ncbi:MAG TPA: hypothetical protein VGJ81_18260 [Thermoanaerobaculia bacterium]|jgi:hypothetical protein